MKHFSSNKDFYDSVDSLCLRLSDSNLEGEADKIRYLLHSVPWNSTSELFPALQSAFEELVSGPNAARLPLEIENQVNDYIQLLKNV